MPPEQKTSWLLRLRQTVKESRERRIRHEPQPPWLVRHTPKKLRKLVVGFYLLMGIISVVLFGFAVLAGFISVPLMYAHSQDTSPLADWMRRYVRWLQGHFSQENFGPAYVIIQMCVAGIMLYFIRGLKWASKKMEKDKLDLA